MDVIGRSPLGEEGEYFRASIWQWPPLTDLLDSGFLIPPDWMVDELREAEIVSMWDDVHGYLETVKRAYRRNNWQAQPRHVEVWCEKATVLGSMRPITREFGVRLRPCRGFGSTGMETEIGGLYEGIDKSPKRSAPLLHRV
jgi:hypothetical protein